MSRARHSEGFYKHIPFTPWAVRIPWWLGVRLYSRACAKMMLTDDVLAFFACAKPNCSECQEIAERSSICAYRATS